jgi:NADPH2 dehydrogenase
MFRVLIQVTDAVHAQGSFIYCQLWALGRAAVESVLEAEGGYPYVSSSDVKLSRANIAPRSLTQEGELSMRASLTETHT